jgi:hypothetical protein
VERGTALLPFNPGDVLLVDLKSSDGGPGFAVGYVVDVKAAADVIPATGNCTLNEILLVKFQRPPEQRFSRGDVDGSAASRRCSLAVTAQPAIRPTCLSWM